jgi:hypothetical protein
LLKKLRAGGEEEGGQSLLYIYMSSEPTNWFQLDLDKKVTDIVPLRVSRISVGDGRNAFRRYDLADNFLPTPLWASNAFD